MSLRLGMSSGALYPEVPTEDSPAVAAGFGLHDLELLLQTAGEYQPAFVKAAKANAIAAGCRVHALHTFQPLHPIVTAYRRRTEEAIALFRLGIDAVVELGASAIVWHGLSRSEANGPEAWETFIRAAEQLGRYCGEAGVTLAVENVSWCAVATVRDAMAFAARLPELGPPGAIGFAFDPFQSAEAGANPFMMLAAMEGAIADVHLSDHAANDASARHLPPGDGDLPWPALIRAIAASGYGGPMMLEANLPNASAVARVRGVLDPLIAAVVDEGDPCAGTPPAGVLAGVELFNDRRFHEAHEEIEHEWHAERRPIRRFYQGILQIGVGFHHALGGNKTGAILLLNDGIAKVSEFLPVCQGIDTTRLVRESQFWLDDISARDPADLGSIDPEALPQVEFVHAQIDRGKQRSQ